MIWQPRGKDASGADTHVGTNTRGTFIVASHKVGGINLYRLDGAEKTLVSIGFTSVKAAQEYVDRL